MVHQSLSFIPSLLVHNADKTENYSTAIVVGVLLPFRLSVTSHCQDNTLVNSPTWLQRYTHPSKRREVW